MGLTKSATIFRQWLRGYAKGRQYHYIIAHPWEELFIVRFDKNERAGREFVAYYKGVPMYTGDSKTLAMEYLSLERMEDKVTSTKLSAYDGIRRRKRK
jgi:hypothetical protein